MAGIMRGRSIFAPSLLLLLSAAAIGLYLLQQTVQEAFLAPAGAQASRRSAVMIGAAGLLAAEANTSPAFAEKTKAEIQEQCLSQCVYQCTGGARGKGSEYKNRRVCIEECKDECLGGERAAFLEVS
mmetsp:Transcript_27442/g.64082  ORF Transcript_27442/g.64082 Transcript_27442/m.64082 type:complete len:127 (+) Transcript_27442:88-468(+)|eukprot:CAMPEP_0178427766 /NCGR_PEP_ID=MMETSP0689_2-20121128/29914_1 /TAXON_ID=160604 /ORGANISM="Amphidinium massartii, Strain CS-259" /LENGTH=126 /DNA_ID=CAMNT_0020049483 /DNA_START=12 /DNA_END=392 /DNA_ORIENTATION=+